MKLLATVFFSLLMFSATAQDNLNEATGNWAGALELPGGQSLRIVFHISNDGEALSATMDSPDQGAFGMKMDKAAYGDKTIELTMNQIQGTYKGTLKDGKFEGTWSQSGQTFPLNLEKVVKEGKI